MCEAGGSEQRFAVTERKRGAFQAYADSVDKDKETKKLNSGRGDWEDFWSLKSVAHRAAAGLHLDGGQQGCAKCLA